MEFNWKHKLLDNLISQKVLFGMSFMAVLMFVPLTEVNAKSLETLMYVTMGASAVKSVASAYKAKKGA